MSHAQRTSSVRGAQRKGVGEAGREGARKRGAPSQVSLRYFRDVAPSGHVTIGVDVESLRPLVQLIAVAVRDSLMAPMARAVRASVLMPSPTPPSSPARCAPTRSPRTSVATESRR